MSQCTIDGCELPRRTRGWCNIHYERWRHNGHPLVVRRRCDQGSAIERFVRKIVVSDDGCWLWLANASRLGYGGFRDENGKMVRAHRWAYEYFKEKIPAGLFLDHLCRRPQCVNPDHVEPVTPHENTLRSPIAPSALMAKRTHCNYGHPYSGDNLFVRSWRGKSRRRICRTCQNQRAAVYRKQKLEAASA